MGVYRTLEMVVCPLYDRLVELEFEYAGNQLEG